jgi:hypothetical protein
MSHISNNLVETARLMGNNSKEWKNILQIGHGLETFATNLRSFQSQLEMNITGGFSIEMCSNYWSMAIGAISVLSAILNDDDEDEESPFNMVLKDLFEIKKALQIGFERLESILLETVCKRLELIYGQLIRMETIMCDSFRDLHRKDLLNICDAIKKDLSGEFIQTNQERRNLLSRLSTWIDHHCSSSIEVAKNRMSLDQPNILIEMLPTADTSFIINLAMIMLQSKETLPNMGICLSACELFSIAHKKWKIDYNIVPMYKRVIGIIKDCKCMIEVFDQDDIDTLVRQINHYKFAIGREISKANIEINSNTAIGVQINKMTCRDTILQLVDSIELRRLIIIEICKLRGLDSPILQTKENYLKQIPKIERTPNRAPFHGVGYPSVHVRHAPIGGHRIAESGTSAELLYYLEMGLNVNYHCGWGNVLLNHLLSTKQNPTSLHYLLKCPNIDTQTGQACRTDMGSTWPIGSRPITYILNCQNAMLAIIFSANGYDIDSTNYGGHWQGGHWGDCGNLHNWAQDGSKQGIITLEIVKLMEDKNSFWNRDKLRVAYKYYKEYESGLEHTDPNSEFEGDKKSLFIFSCILGLVPPCIKYTDFSKNSKQKITPNLTWFELSEYTKLMNWNKFQQPSEKQPLLNIKSDYYTYLQNYKEKLESIINIPISEKPDQLNMWIKLLEPMCKTNETVQLLTDIRIGDIKQNLNLLNAILKTDPTYNLGTNIDIYLTSLT